VRRWISGEEGATPLPLWEGLGEGSDGTDLRPLPPTPSHKGRGSLSAPARFVARIAALRGLRADLAALGLGVFAALALPPVYALPVLLVSFPR